MPDLHALPDLRPAVPGVWPAAVLEDPDEDLRALEAAELRLLAQATGEHLPAELHDQVLELRARRARLIASTP